jgi:hypothetical protein
MGSRTSDKFGIALVRQPEEKERDRVQDGRIDSDGVHDDWTVSEGVQGGLQQW